MIIWLLVERRGGSNNGGSSSVADVVVGSLMRCVKFNGDNC